MYYKKISNFRYTGNQSRQPQSQKHISIKFNKITVFGIYGPTSFKLFHKTTGKVGLFSLPKNRKGSF